MNQISEATMRDKKEAINYSEKQLPAKVMSIQKIYVKTFWKHFLSEIEHERVVYYFHSAEFDITYLHVLVNKRQVSKQSRRWIH